MFSNEISSLSSSAAAKPFFVSFLPYLNPLINLFAVFTWTYLISAGFIDV